jgi:O-antigen ligase
MSNLILGAAIIIIFAIFLVKPKAGLYAVAFFLPAIGWSFYVKGLELTLIDLLALLLVLAFFGRFIFFLLFSRRVTTSWRWPIGLPFVIFLSISLLSAIFSADPLYSLWYIVRWPAFLYIAYIFVPYNLITDGKTLKKTIIAVVAGAILVLISGLLSLYGQDWRDSFFRISSVSLFGVYPYGINHNLIAEFLGVGAFLVLAWRSLVKGSRGKRVLDILFAMMSIGVILTFSRAGWITLFLQLLIYAAFYFRVKKQPPRQLVLALIGALIILTPLAWKMGQLQRDNTSSTENRWLLTEISIQAFSNKPYLGYGSGEFINLVDNNLRFKAKYGPAIDSHGMIQKVLAENGAFGLAAWLFIIIHLIKSFWTALKKYYNRNPWLLPLILAGAGGLFFQIFNTSYYKGKVWLPIVLALAAINLIEKHARRKNAKQPE